MSYVEIHGFDPIERGRRRKEWIEPMKKKEKGGGITDQCLEGVERSRLERTSFV